MLPKIIVSDYDLTLTNEKGIVSDTTISSIKYLKKAGILFGIATGRKNENIVEAIKENGIFGLCDFIVSANGAELYDAKTNKIIHFNWLKKETLLAIESNFKNRDIIYFLEEKNRILTQRENSAVNRIVEFKNQKIVYQDLKDLKDDEVPKIIFSIEDHEKEWMNDFLEKYPTINHAYGFYTHQDIVEYVDVDVSKYEGFKHYCEIYGIDPLDSIAFGDSNNDLALIKHVGKGVAVKNATEEVKLVADEIIDNSGNDSVAKFINALLV